MENKPQLTFWQIWNMSFGFLGIQFFGSVETGGNFDEITPNKTNSGSALPSLSLDAHGFRIFKRK